MFRRPVRTSAERTSNHLSFPSYTLLFTSTRWVVQSGKGGMRSILDQYETAELRKKLSNNRNGNYYRFQQKLWPSLEAMETELTKIHYSPVERNPLEYLPIRKEAPKKYFTCEGRGGVALLEQVEREEKEKSLSSSSLTTNSVETEEGDEMLSLLLESANTPIKDKILNDNEVEGSLLESTSERVRNIICEDLNVNTLAIQPSPQRTDVARETKTSKDLAGSSWEALGLDPVIALAAAQLLGPIPSRLQTRLIPALINEDHNDVLLNGVTGSGKSTALILSILHGIRNENAGFNVVVAHNTMTAMRLHDLVKALARRVGGGELVDRPAEDDSWLFLGTFREDYNSYYRRLRSGLKSPHGPVRLMITTADVFTELLFEKKMEFADFGYLRRVYLDDVGVQVPMLPETASIEAAKERNRNPLAAELLLGTLHQMPGPHIRSVLQLGLVSADVDAKLKKHLQALCMKPTAQTVILSPVRLPSTIHCLFSFYLPQDDRWTFLAGLIWNARSTIPGRGIIFVHHDEDILHTRRKLRSLGMNVKLFSEVYGDGVFKDTWRFLLLKESEAFGIDIPLVSHVFITFVPSSWQTYLHMCGRTGRLGNVGWVYTVTDKRGSRAVRLVAQDLEVDFTHHVVNQDLSLCDPTVIDRQTKDPTLYGLDPQYAVNQHYEVQSENPDFAYRPREFFSKPNVKKDFLMEDYTPVREKERAFKSASALAKDIEANPALVDRMKEKGYLNQQMRPTKKLKKVLNHKLSKQAPSPLDGK